MVLGNVADEALLTSWLEVVDDQPHWLYNITYSLLLSLPTLPRRKDLASSLFIFIIHSLQQDLLTFIAMAPSKPHIVLYTSGTPNGQKASITLEELGLPYEVENIQISKNVQKEDWFLKINPNGRIPAIVDKTPSSDGKPREKRIFESGALMLYLCERYDSEYRLSYPYNSDEYWEVVEWLVWMQSGLGPMQVC